MTLKFQLADLQRKAKERTVRTQNIEYDLETLVKKIDRKTIKLNPDYQRRHRWTVEASSRLIESLILNIPIPYVYISLDIDVDDEISDEDEQYRYSVIDGQQRITAIYEFMKGKYPLSGLEVLSPLNDAFYSDLPAFLIRRLEERTIKCLRIDSTIDPQVKYDIFERLNTGALKLESQELRNAIYRGPFKDLLIELCSNSDFKNTTNLSNKKIAKMDDQEIILRFFSLHYNNGYTDYKSGFKKFLNDKMEFFNGLGENELKDMKHRFEETFKRIANSKVDMPFSNWSIDNTKDKIKKKSSFNVAVYDTVCRIYYLGNEKFTRESLTSFLFGDPSYVEACSGSYNDVSKLRTRMTKATELYK
ncbi:DUF262 domain-containing protein [Xenorhabdus bovienii]|uniref:GmrSD restriction endonucleases N-terminal domain-containing protein n=2 Tax=Xenorhabdus bovienii TaxID=40576 RepID=A0A077PGF1_XENBV|nr:DUF262 domain-containing protein [Xenorhabdus bovienii]MDE1480533.1 DUF262 domain-containing protein [Xenorhabdus bovienii]MDE1488778.1 DUF262 domain-containing protein [Xenorhabdus bovienii]MDE9479642.1 DUF262 domain-containing protein [Xenorhabdus bovienii]MDE9512247.1 DUF262 domain-containing protein [Xenorhabdus bovienii]MDE9523889.1 DUF262 domain-containing protein [Xenorhabdus bovienii]